MAQSFYLFDAGAGASISETSWRAMAHHFAQSGFVECLTGTAGSDAAVNLASGSAMVASDRRKVELFSARTRQTPSRAQSASKLDR